MRRWMFGLLLAASLVATSDAGVYCTQETLAELPSQWRGFLLDQRLLRLAAVPPKAEQAANPVRQRYTQEVATLRKAIGDKALTADQAADLGALYLRLGDTNRALEVLLPAQREHGEHFRLAANLGTALHRAGELQRAREVLRDAVRLAPAKYRGAEELHLRLVDLRLREQRSGQRVTALDDLFGVRYQAADGSYKPGEVDPAERKKLPADAVARVQLLALALPDDARLLWQLAELAAVHGDVVLAASMLDGCVTEFNWPDPVLREHRRLTRAVADERLKAGTGKEEHGKGHVKLETKSSRPLVSRIDQVALPPIDPKGVNALPWSLVTDTAVDAQLRPTFPKRLTELDGLDVTLTGYMQPLGDDVECASFLLIEFPVGCWFCETPGLNGLVLVDLPDGRSQTFTRDALQVTGRFKLNKTDPESFLFQVGPAKVKAGE